MPSERDLRRRVRSVKNIQQLTRAMQLVAASKMRRAQEAVLASRPFEQKLRSVLNELAPYADRELSPLLHRRTPVRRVAIVLITTDRGLVGPMTVYQAILESKASQWSAQMVAMRNATDAADDLISDLILAANKARQTRITKEMLEIASGAEALKG